MGAGQWYWIKMLALGFGICIVVKAYERVVKQIFSVLFMSAT